MSEDNLYAPPKANLEVPHDESTGETILAGRWARLGAAILDSVVSIAALAPIMYFSGFWDRAMTGSVTILETLGFAVLGLIIYVVLNGHFLSKYGQTIGKRLLGIKIVSVETNEILPLWKVIAVRYLPVAITGQIPMVGGFIVLLDSLLIYRKDKRCGHDMIAGTQVIKAK